MFAQACEDLAYEIAFWMQGLDKADLSLDEHAKLVEELGSHLRSLAIMVLLGFGKTDRFHHNLIRGARLRLGYLQRCQETDALEEHDFVSGILDPLFDSIAAGDWDLSLTLMRAAPPAYRRGHEYEDDFCSSQLLRQLVEGVPDSAAWAALLHRAEAAFGDPAHPRLALFRAIGERDQAAFDKGFEALLRARSASIDAASKGELAGAPVLAQRAVFIEGLAMLQLAQRFGLVTAPEYAMCPSLARVPMVEPVPEA